MALCALSVQASPQVPSRWKLCATCHGDQGFGRRDVHAPAIAGLPDWYIKRQLEKFQTNVRGAHPDDVEGHLMRPMARALPPKEIEGMAAYISSMPKKPQESLKTAFAHEFGGDAEKGKALYATCMACHGMNGEGNPALKAPSQFGMEGWYMLSQLKKFKAGIRGNNTADIEAMTMKPIVATLADEKAMKDVVAYILTLSGQAATPPPVAQN
jgi:cytochrome c553